MVFIYRYFLYIALFRGQLYYLLRNDVGRVWQCQFQDVFA